MPHPSLIERWLAGSVTVLAKDSLDANLVPTSGLDTVAVICYKCPAAKTAELARIFVDGAGTSKMFLSLLSYLRLFHPISIFASSSGAPIQLRCPHSGVVQEVPYRLRVRLVISSNVV